MSQSAIARLVGRAPIDEAHLRAMKAAAFHKQGVVCLHLDEIRNPIVREVFEQEASRHFGKRDIAK
jgi:hypothetical protein